MPTRGLSLVGFMGQQQALDHLSRACVPTPAAIPVAALMGEWQAATNALGTPFSNAGKPDIQPIPAAHSSYLQAMQADAWTANALASLPSHSIQLVEIEPLLAFQFLIDIERSQQHCGHLSSPPDMAQLFSICLPIGEPAEPFQWSANPQGTALLVKSRSLNLRHFNTNLNATQGGAVLTVALGFPPPFIQVTRFAGSCFLFNGYHRAYGVRAAGHTHLPCVVRDVSDYEAAGVRSDGSTFGPAAFDPTLLGASGMPTLGHFTTGRAHPVSVRSVSRSLTFSWAEHATPDE